MLQLVVALMKRQAKFLTQQQVDLVDSDNEDIFSDGQDMETAIKYHSELSSTHKFTFLKDYYPPFEPDGNVVKMWLRGNNLGSTTQDYSGFNRFATIYGDPTLVDGTIDLGIFDGGAVKSIARRMNRPTSDYENLEWLQVPDSGGIQVTDQTIGTSIFVRFRIFSLADQEGRSPTIFQKIDDSTPNNGIMLQVKDDGRLVCIVKRGGTTTAKETAPSTITTTGTSSSLSYSSFDPASFDPISFDTLAELPPVITGTNIPYDVFITYAAATPAINIYVNGENKTLSNFSGSVNWQTTLTNHDFFIFRRGLGDAGGFVYGDFYDLKYYRNRVITQQEVTNHYNNKWTISDIDFGHVMVTNYWATIWAGGAAPGEPSFTGTSFTPTSFTV